MENIGYAALQIIPSMKGFESKLTSGTSGPLSAAGSKGGLLFGNSAGRSMTSSIAAHAKKAAFLGAAAFSAVGLAAFKLGKDSIAEARESQKVGALTASVIKATGGAANVTAKQVGDLAGALSLKTGIDDEVIQSGQNMLLTFKNVRNEVGKGNDIFDQSTKTLVDMSSAMGTEPKQAAIQLGKALNDPIKGISALSRVGVTFTDQQKAQIKALVESGDTMKAQKIILGELKSEFGGAAAAQATMGDKVKTAWGNIEEQLGTALLPLLDKLERWFLKKGVPAIEGWIDVFQKKAVPALKDFGHWITTKGVDKFQDFYDKAKPIVAKTLPAMKDAFEALKPLLKKAGEFAGNMAEQFTKMPKWAQTAIVGGLLVGKAGGFKITASLVGKTLASKAAPLPVFVVNQGFGGTGGGVPGGGGPKGIPPIVAAAPKALPKFAPFIPIGLGSAPGHGNSLMKDLFGFGLGSNDKGPDTKLALPPEVKQSIVDATHAYDDFGEHALGAFHGVDKAIDNALPLVKRYQQVLGQTPKQVATTFTVNGIDRAVAQADTLIGKLRYAADVARGLDNGVTFQHGGQIDSRVTAHHGRG